MPHWVLSHLITLMPLMLLLTLSLLSPDQLEFTLIQLVRQMLMAPLLIRPMVVCSRILELILIILLAIQWGEAFGVVPTRWHGTILQYNAGLARRLTCFTPSCKTWSPTCTAPAMNIPFPVQHIPDSGVSDAGAFVLAETALNLHCWGQNPVVTAKLQLNGQDRFSEREGTYFDLVQPYQHHTRNVP